MPVQKALSAQRVQRANETLPYANWIEPESEAVGWGSGPLEVPSPCRHLESGPGTSSPGSLATQGTLCSGYELQSWLSRKALS